MRQSLFVLLASLSAIAGPANACAPDVGIEAVRAHLLYAFSGTLSDDILAREEPFIGWNTPIGGGDADEAADDLLVVVEIGSTGEVYLDGVLEIRVTNEHGEEIGLRKFDGLLTSEEGKGAFALYLPDSTCGGMLTIEASLLGEKKSAQLQLYCGE